MVRDIHRQPFYNVPAAFDTESSSFYDGGEKRSCMYAWMFTADDNGVVCLGRTWDEYVTLMDALAYYGDTAIVPIYVHNLQWDFQFIRRWSAWERVFAISNRRPVYARTNTGVEYRCSYILTNYALDTVAKNLHRHSFRKMIGDLDYDLIRHSGTPLTDAEIGYCVHDVLIVCAHIAEQIDENGNICGIPLTATGYVRRYVKRMCLRDPDVPKKQDRTAARYRDSIRDLTLTADEYAALKRAYAGGYTHASAWHVPRWFDGEQIDVINENVTSLDETSAYPYALVSVPMYPMSHATVADDVFHAALPCDRFDWYINHFACLFDIVFDGLEATFPHDHYISEYKCRFIGDVTVDNHRVVSADRCAMTITEQDWCIIRDTYTWRSATIGVFRWYRRGYLPKPIIASILSLYAQKTALKWVKGREAEYQHAKEGINSVYGMMVTDIVRDSYQYTGDEWQPVQHADVEKMIEKYNAGSGRVLFYPWGVWCCAIARKNLWTMIIESGPDHVYSDTDSEKMLHYERHKDAVERYNTRCIRLLDYMCDTLGFDRSMTRPKTINGVEKPLGVFDYECTYKRFKTLGAKRYLVENQDGSMVLTVSGLKKQKTIDYLRKKYGDNTAVFHAFNNHMIVPAEHTGKMTHTYIDSETQGIVTDYRGIPGEYHELSSIHLEKQPYEMQIMQDYIDFITSVVLEREEIET